VYAKRYAGAVITLTDISTEAELISMDDTLSKAVNLLQVQSFILLQEVFQISIQKVAVCCMQTSVLHFDCPLSCATELQE
jgi:hypothetical protein